MFNNFISDREVTKDWHEMITLYNLHEEYLLWLINMVNYLTTNKRKSIG